MLRMRNPQDLLLLTNAPTLSSFRGVEVSGKPKLRDAGLARTACLKNLRFPGCVCIRIVELGVLSCMDPLLLTPEAPGTLNVGAL